MSETLENFSQSIFTYNIFALSGLLIYYSVMLICSLHLEILTYTEIRV